MSTDFTSTTPAAGADRRSTVRPDPRRVLSTETKSATKTTELIAYVLAVAGVLIASAMIGNDGDESDFFRADRAWLYVVVLTVGYMISRGLAKAGSREDYDA